MSLGDCKIMNILVNFERGWSVNRGELGQFERKLQYYKITSEVLK